LSFLVTSIFVSFHTSGSLSLSLSRCSLKTFVYCFIVIIVIAVNAAGLKNPQNGVHFSMVVKLYRKGTGALHLHTTGQPARLQLEVNSVLAQQTARSWTVHKPLRIVDKG
jgi:hypothetical protein